MLSKLNIAIHAALIGIIAWFAVDEYGFLWIEGDNAREARCREDKSRIVQAGEDALRSMKAAVAAQEARQQRISDDAKQTYLARINALSERYNRLRAQAADRPARVDPVPGLPAPAFGTTPAAGEDRLSLDERLECSTYATQLDELITWVEAVAD